MNIMEPKNILLYMKPSVIPFQSATAGAEND